MAVNAAIHSGLQSVLKGILAPPGPIFGDGSSGIPTLLLRPRSGRPGKPQSRRLPPASRRVELRQISRQ